jgi:hypothetical protein
MRHPFVVVDIENTGFVGGRPAPKDSRWRAFLP